ncbi:MAG: hypothetical protein WC030_01365 [Candidatus Paceibacterota bacterium]
MDVTIDKDKVFLKLDSSNKGDAKLIQWMNRHNWRRATIGMRYTDGNIMGLTIAPMTEEEAARFD